MMDGNAYRLVAENLTKRYFGAIALVDVSLSIRPGEIHGLLGENGAGKSTLLKIISGVHRPDSGRVVWEGQPVEIPSPRAAGALGIAMIHQELNLVQDLSVAENVFIRREPTRRFGLIDWPALWRATRELLRARRDRPRPAGAGARSVDRRAADGGDRARAVGERAAADHGRADLVAAGARVQPSLGLDEDARPERHIDPVRHPSHGRSARRVRPLHGAARRASRWLGADGPRFRPSA